MVLTAMIFLSCYAGDSSLSQKFGDLYIDQMCRAG